jgi:GPI mannosyltransferase 3
MYSTLVAQATENSSSSSSATAGSSSSTVSSSSSKWAVAAVLALHLPPALYLSTLHQRGPLAIMEALQSELAATTATTPATTAATAATSATQQQRSVAFLMPCHSTPFYSHLHTRGQWHNGASPLQKPLEQPLQQQPLLLLRALDCSPEVPRGTSESARFETDALALVSSMYSSSSSSSSSSSRNSRSSRSSDSSQQQQQQQLPEYIVTYPLYSDGALRPWLQQHSYSEVRRVFNTHCSGDADALHTHHHIVLLRRSISSSSNGKRKSASQK